MGRLGLCIRLVTRLSDDAFGRSATARLLGARATLEVQPAPSTGIVVVSVDGAVGPSYDFASSWEPAVPVLPAGAAVLRTGSLGTAPSPGIVPLLSGPRPAGPLTAHQCPFRGRSASSSPNSSDH